ncbi:MAG TPA: FtsX-like permease family protein, partial [Terriglobia bacterium]|nr:FtsX-like permease family protein [Terriglobia bacterium]
DTPGLSSAHLNSGVLGFTLLLSLLTGITFGLVPALTASRVDINHSLKETGRSSTASARTRGRLGLLVSWELALAVVLLAGAGLLIKTFVALTHVDMGIDPRNVLTMWVSLSSPQYAKRAREVEFFKELLKKVEALPGVTSAAVLDGGGLPPDGGNGYSFLIAGRPTPPASEYPDAVNRVISRDYFRTMGIQLLRGRLFTESDDAGSPNVAVINERMARDYWPEDDPIGSQLTFPYIEMAPDSRTRTESAVRFTIVGVVKNVKNRGLEVQPDEEVYVLYTQEPTYSVPRMLLVKSSVESGSLVSAIRSQVEALDPAQPIGDIATLDEIVTQARAGSRFPMVLLVLFAGLALMLAAVGIYGVMSYSVGQRVHEIGIRIALGADRSDVLGLVVGQGAKLAAIGVGMGLAAALSLTWLMSKVLFGVRPQDPLTFVAVILILIAVAVFATYVPARRATNVDPIIALREE